MRVPNTPHLFILLLWRENAIKVKKCNFSSSKQSPKPGNFEGKALYSQPYVHTYDISG